MVSRADKRERIMQESVLRLARQAETELLVGRLEVCVPYWWLLSEEERIKRARIYAGNVNIVRTAPWN